MARRCIERAGGAPHRVARLSLLVALSGAAGCGSSAVAGQAVELPPPPSDAPGERSDPVEATPAWSLGGYALGQSEAELVRIAGEPSEVRSLEDEANLWRGAGYDPESEGPFLTGFDHVLEFVQAETARLGERAPLFKAFVRRGKVVALTFTAFGVDANDVRTVGFSPCTFLAPESTIEARFGPAEAIEPSGQGFEFLYPSRGLSVITEGGHVYVMHFHEPLRPRDAQRVRQRVSTEAPEVDDP